MSGSDFQDDGGTPMWRRRQAEIILDGSRRPDRTKLTTGQAAILIVFFALVLPYLIIFGGLLVAGLIDAITG